MERKWCLLGPRKNFKIAKSSDLVVVSLCLPRWAPGPGLEGSDLWPRGSSKRRLWWVHVKMQLFSCVREWLPPLVWHVCLVLMYMRCFKLISISNKAQKSILHALLLFSKRQCIDFNLFCKVWLGEGEFTSDTVTGSASRQPTLLCPFLPCWKAPTQRQIRAET